ncbi:reverse transcriptase domain-containing protein [Tanacetum coccineum]
MADDQPMWGNNRVVAPTPGAAIVAVAYGDNFTVKVVEVLTHHQSVTTSLWEVPKTKKRTMPTEVTEEEDIEETTTVGVPRIDETGVQRIENEAKTTAVDRLLTCHISNDMAVGPTCHVAPLRWGHVALIMIGHEFFNLKTKVEQGQKNHQASIQDLETKFGRLSDQCSSRPIGSLPSNTQTNLKPSPTNDKPYRQPSARNEHVNAVFTRSSLTYNSPVNPNAKTTVIHDDSDDEVDEAKKEVEPSSSKQTKSDPPPLKAYEPKISYPQRLRKEKIEGRYAKFIDLIKEVRINVPLVDVLAGMPNYGKFLKDLVRNKIKMEQISDSFLNEKCFVIVQNKLPPKLGSLGSFLIPCTIVGSVEYLALADLGASINLMPYSLYASLSGNTLKPTRMSIRLANHTYQYPMGIAENMLLQVGKFVFSADFVIL